MADNRKLSEEELDLLIDFVKNGTSHITQNKDKSKAKADLIRLDEILTRPASISTVMHILQSGYNTVLTGMINTDHYQIALLFRLMKDSIVSRKKVLMLANKLHRNKNISDDAYETLSKANLSISKDEISSAQARVDKKLEETQNKLKELPDEEYKKVESVMSTEEDK